MTKIRIYNLITGTTIIATEKKRGLFSVDLHYPIDVDFKLSGDHPVLYADKFMKLDTGNETVSIPKKSIILSYDASDDLAEYYKILVEGFKSKFDVMLHQCYRSLLNKGIGTYNETDETPRETYH